MNEFISTGTVDGVVRKWLAHSATISQGQVAANKTEFENLKSGAYGVVTHSTYDQAVNRDEVTPILEFMDFLHKKDPAGKYSKTVSEIMEQKLLPEKAIDLTKTTLPPPTNGNSTNPLCGDNQCDAKEKADPTLCPRDCGS